MTYTAFISYSRKADAELAATLRSALQGFAKPWYRLRAVRVFQDTSTLTLDPSIWDSVRRALDGSEYLILLASPAAADSPWVNRELEHWLDAHPLESVLLVLSDGDVAWDTVRGRFDPHGTTSLPPALMAAYRHEPLYLDLRWVEEAGGPALRRDPRLRDAVAGLSAVLRHQPKDDLIGEDVRTHRNARRLAWSAGLVTFGLAVTASAAAVMANAQRREAVRQRDRANARLLGVQAEQLLDQNPELLPRSVLLAIEAVRHGAGPEAEQVLRSAVGLLPRLVTEIDAEALGRVNSLSFGPSGDRLAVGGDRGIGLWSPGDGRPLIAAEGAGVDTLFFDADGSSLRAIRDGRVVRLAVSDLETADTLRTFGLGRARLGGSDPGWVAWPLPDGSIEVTALAGDGPGVTLAPRGTEPEAGRALAVALSADGALLSAATSEGRIDVWALPSGRPVRTFPTPSERGFAVPLLALSPTGDRLAAVRRDDRVEVWRLDAEGPALAIRQGSPVGRLLFAPDGRRLVTTGGGVVRFWDAEGHEVQRIPGEEVVDALAFSRDGARMAVARRNAPVRVWDLTASRAGTLPVPVDRANAVALSSDGRYL
ncbi:MAG TPA: TIR domain-containing protein, partial [Longimicrobiales bacterium]|nr:TIR domain-containing protein [Longimicrobiales bacterium]